MVTYSLKYTSVGKVRSGLAKGKLRSLKVLKQDKGVFRSPTYDVWNLIYDTHSRVVKNFFMCRVCGELAQKDLSQGNFYMRRHPCYREYAKKKAEELAIELAEAKAAKKAAKGVAAAADDGSDVSDEDEEARPPGDEDPIERVALGELISEFTRLCRHTHLEPSDAQRIASSSWKPSQW